MPRATLALALLVAACAPAGAPPQLSRAPDFSGREVRQPALFVRVGESADMSAREREQLAATYEGALIEALDERGVPPTDVQRVAPGAGVEPRSALARAREVRADYAIIVFLQVERRDAIVCRNSRRPFSAVVTVWTQAVQVLRVRDGTSRIAIPAGQGLDVTDLEPDCANPRRSRLRDRAEMTASAIEVLTERVLGR
jgi:hypothetical protein